MPCTPALPIPKPTLPTGFSIDPPKPPAPPVVPGICCVRATFADVPFPKPKPALPAAVVAAIDTALAVVDAYLDELDAMVTCPKE